MNVQDKMPLVAALKEYSQKEPAYFCIPGHRFGRGVSKQWVSNGAHELLRFDLTEATGLDDLHQPSGVIKEAQELMAQLFHARKSFFLVNGTTCGNEAMIINSLKTGDKIIVPRNVHKSVLAGLILSGAVPIFITPEWIPKWGIWGALSPDKIRAMLSQQPDIKAVLTVTPSYYGIVDKLPQISRICQEFGCLLLVDEAHGAHFYFSEALPEGALASGADMCTQSFHKVTGSLTQSSVLHVASKQIDVDFLRNNLQMFQSSSPSYLLMASLDAARYELAQHGNEMSSEALSLAEEARVAIAKIEGIRCLGREVVGHYEVADVDMTKLVVSATDIGISGFELKAMLMREYGVELELADHNNVLLVLTFANTKDEVRRLVKALTKIAQSSDKVKGTIDDDKVMMPPLPVMKVTPRDAHFSKKKVIRWADAYGEVAAEAIIPYPPGIPIVYKGELINQEIWNYVNEFKLVGCHFHGVADETLETFAVIDSTIN